MRVPIICWQVALACGAPALTTAQPAPPPISQQDAIVVTANRVAQPYKKVLGDVTVLDRDVLAEAGQSTLAEVLARSHGIEYVNNGNPQGMTSLFMRGANSNQTLVLLDGQRINNATNGLPALNALAPANIERVEIVRGALSSLYGADAMGGVINIITQPASTQPFSAWTNAGVGTYATGSYNAGLAGTTDGWRYSLAAGYGQSSGYNASNRKNIFNYNPDKDSYYQNNVATSLGYTWQPEQTLAARYYRSRVNSGYDNGLPYFNDRAIQTVAAYTLASTNRLTDFWLSMLRVGSTVDNNRSENAPGDVKPGDTPDGISVFRTHQTQYVWQNDLTLAPQHKLTLAYEYLRQSVAGDIADFHTYPPTFTDYRQTHRHTNSYTGVYLGDFGRHHVQASLRNDRNSQFGSHTTGGLTYGWDITPDLRAIVAGNTGFRAPGFNELYWPDDSGFRGNPNLKPEKSRNAEMGLRYEDGTSELGATYYHNRIHNLIVNEQLNDPQPIYQPYNVGKATLTGFTFTGARRFGHTRLRVEVDLTDPRNDDTGRQLPQRARQVLRLLADHRIGKLRLGGEWYVSDQRYDALTGDRLAGYGLCNLIATYDLTSNIQIQVRWNNVFDHRYTLLQGYNTPGSNAFVNLRWHM